MTRQKLTPIEQELVRKARLGSELHCDEINLEELAVTEDQQRIIRAEVIRDLLALRHGPLHPRGICVKYARITGKKEAFDFNSFTFNVGLKLEHCWLDNPIIAYDARVPWLHLDGCAIPHFLADRMRVEGSLYLRGLQIQDAGDMGAVRLLGARIGRNLELDRACLNNDYGPALHAEGIQVDRALRFRAAEARVTCDTGAIQLVNARVRGDLWLDGTTVRNEGGPALNAEGLQVGGSLLLCSGFNAKATSTELATVHLMSARIGSRLDLSEGRDITGRLWGVDPGDERDYLPRRAAVVKNSHKTHLALDLGCASTNELRLPAETVCSPKDDRCSTGNKIVLVGLKYATLSHKSAHEHWPHWLSKQHTNQFEAEPYQHLATILRNSGRAAEARRLLIELENERHERGPGTKPSSPVWHWIKRTVIGHGYKPGRALFGLLGVFLLAMLVTLMALGADSIHHPELRVAGLTSTSTQEPTTEPGVVPSPTTTSAPSSTTTSADQCNVGEAVRLAADLSVPLINTNGRLRCDFRPDGAEAQTGMVLGIFLQVLGWAFATLFVAGFTGVIRKD